MLWVDKHRPHSLDKLDYHDHITHRLENLVILHILFFF